MLSINTLKNIAIGKIMTFASDQKLNADHLSATSRSMLALREAVLAEWETRTRAALLQAKKIKHPVFINTMPPFYDNIVEALTPDYPRADGVNASTLAGEHGGERARMTNYDPEALILEYQIFRQSIFDVLEQHSVSLTSKEVLVINSSIDQAIREAATAFSLVVAALREQFVAALAHDMRTPLGTAAMAAQLISMTTDSPKTKDLAGKIADSVQRIDTMIHGLLDTMVFQSGSRLQLRISQFDILDVVEEIKVQFMNSRGKECEVIGQPLLGWWGKESLQRAVENLIGNALKYGTPDTPIRIKIDEVHERLLLTVHNEGPPIPADEQEGVFQIFRRAQEAKKGNHQGWGVGLPYVRAVAESHGGSVGIDSHPDRGTTFMIDIPVDARPFQDAPTVALNV